MREPFDCLVMGGGPGGYVAAIRAASLGLNTALIEKGELGGTCLNRGCIPSKALIASGDLFRKVRMANQFGIQVEGVSCNYAQVEERKSRLVTRLRKSLEGLIASHKQLTVFKGLGRLLSPFEVMVVSEQGEERLAAKKIILATGSEPRALPSLAFDYKRIHDSTSFLDLKELPKRLLIIGGGIIGCEFAALHRAFGVEVTLVEMLPALVAPEGRAVSEALLAAFKKQAIRVELGTLVEQLEQREAGVVATLRGGAVLEADQVLVAVGRRYNTEQIGLELAGVERRPDGAIATNEQMQTHVDHIYAIGDITGRSLLAHVASHQALVAVEHMVTGKGQMRYEAIPSVIFTHPEIATVGLSLERAQEAGFAAESGKFPFQALGKAHVAIETEGFAQIVVEKGTGLILGAQVVGAGAATLIAEMGLAISQRLTRHNIQEAIHAHPTSSEVWLEAAFLAEGMPLHLPPLR